MKLTVIGTGYLGAVHAACMAEIGHEVLGVDIDEAKTAALAAGRTPFYEPGLQELLTRGTASGRLRFTTSLREAGRFGGLHFLCVGTPQRPDGLGADLRHVDAAVDGLAPHLIPGALIVGKSTVPVGTAERLTARLRAAGAPEAHLAWNPEFLREGHAVMDTLRPDRLVFGTGSRLAENVLREVYAPLIRSGVPYVATDTATAELVKMAANSFLATKISFINAMAEVCDAAGADVTVLAHAVGYDHRIGRSFLNAGLGFGGGCLPKDIRAFRARAAELGVGPAVAFLAEIDEINLRQRRRTVELATRLAGGELTGRRIAVLGAAFKPESDDVRDSPALAVAARLHREGAVVRVHDPQAVDNARAACPQLDYAARVDKACEGADVVLHLTDWAEYRALDPDALTPLVCRPVLLDARNSLDPDVWTRAGWRYAALGRLGAPAQPSSDTPAQPSPDAPDQPSPDAPVQPSPDAPASA
ncbi:UDP-glucose/GDP-mannose dehydrogenase family protein [Streptomyces actinomycinicus]|uniref:UDP-glucose 6-dehydrogenase n=1 Tax=Streptomyces actinomycinicus TaxID=1695166 RepID=A0A937JR08_9ACTN|nr:UDP-glucose/GDP-mannose dehydrogenase family protein [Streptomyces actinomycinicus]MBL1083998.1 UDP-glucose/GDP-mannose dehydrogenase family protein [Streptomyces actinomycinicus]